MKFTLALAALLLLLTLALLPVDQPSASASTCSMIEIPDPLDRIDSALDGVEVVALGVVTSEGAMRNNTHYYESQISLLAVLKGDPADSELTIPYLGDNCPGGGSRLRPEERVLMMLHQGCYASRAGVPEDCHWALAALGGKILLKPGRAVLEDIGYEPAFVGLPDQVVRDVGRRIGASDAQIEAALLAAGIPQADASDSLAAVVGVAFAALLSLLVAARLLRAQRT